MEVNLQTESNQIPNKFEIENMNTLNNKCDIVINDNVKEVEDTTVMEGQQLAKKYIFDSYRINTTLRDGLEDELKTEAGYRKWLEFAKKLAEEEKSKEIRKKRNELLKQTDWTQLQDRKVDDKLLLAYEKYRQALRDIPEKQDFPFNVQFPRLEDFTK